MAMFLPMLMVMLPLLFRGLLVTSLVLIIALSHRASTPGTHVVACQQVAWVKDHKMVEVCDALVVIG
jgi:hypothetical protein